MLSIRRILFPVDFSHRCSEIIPYVQAFAKTYGCEIVLLHVINPVYSIPDIGIGPSAIVAMPKWLLAKEADTLDQFGLELEGFPVRRLIFEGEPETQILNTIHSEAVQFTVMPTHGYGRFRQYLIGSVTAKVLHDAHCPVLTGAHFAGQSRPGPVKISEILCAIDLGPRTCEVLTFACRLASDLSSSLTVLHVIPQTGTMDNFAEGIEASIREEVLNLQTIGKPKDIRVRVERGDVIDAVCASARTAHADLLIIGRGAQHGQLAGNAYGIIRQSACAVVSI